MSHVGEQVKDYTAEPVGKNLKDVILKENFQENVLLKKEIEEHQKHFCETMRRIDKAKRAFALKHLPATNSKP